MATVHVNTQHAGCPIDRCQCPENAPPAEAGSALTPSEWLALDFLLAALDRFEQVLADVQLRPETAAHHLGIGRTAMRTAQRILSWRGTEVRP